MPGTNPGTTGLVCSRCGKYKRAEDFPVRSDTTRGRVYHCSKCDRIRTHAWRQQNGDIVKRYRHANRDKSKQYQREYYEANKEKIKARNHRNYKANKDAVHDRVKRRRLALADLRVEIFSRLEIWERDGGHCHVCGKRLPSNKFELDHLIPISLGGDHSRRNVAVACRLCNRRRHNTGPAQLRLIG